MDFFVKLPSTMKAKHFTNLNIGLTNCLVHILQSGKISAEDRISFIGRLKESNQAEYQFVTKAVAAMLEAPLNNPQVKENLVYLCQMLVGNNQAQTNASKLFTGLYYEGLILNWSGVVERLSNPQVNIHDDEELMKEFIQKISIAEKWEAKMADGKSQN